MSELPKGWVEIKALEGFDQVSTNGKNVKTKECLVEGDFPVIDQGVDIVSGFINDETRVIKIEGRPIILFGDHTRVVKWIVKDFVPGADGTKLLQAKSFILPRLAFFQLMSLDIPDKGYARHFKFLKELSFFIPPLAEQKRIVEKLDQVLAQVDTIKARLDGIPAILKRFRQSVLAAAVSGKLTEEWRGGESFNSQIKKLGDAGVSIKTGPFGSALHKHDYIHSGVPVINPMHIFEGQLFPSESMTINESKYSELSAWHLRDGDVIVGRRGEMGRAATVKGDQQLLCGTGSMILRVNEDSLPKYLELILRSPTAIQYFNSASVGSTMVNLNQKVIKDLEVYFPPFEEQTEIVRLVDQYFAFADTIEQQVQKAQQRVDKLTQSILAKAFRGELVPQDPTDEPAEELLKRIAAARAEAEALAKAAKKVGKKTGKS